ncbi:MAG: hypothetical protein PHH54_02065 [Candidatus Nanoarchaeia archaeon]|nr:hypothetical protein [Candidatus Nanoarchaeia archaeon]MDD5740747.1 hypothetical protein [Candidatus Nanoarchaeia archaeon]
MESVQILNNRLNKAKNIKEKKAILQELYKQLVKSKTNRKANGLFREFVENDSYNGHKFAWGLAEQLDKYGLTNHARRLREQYSGIPQKPQRDWTELPNVLGNQEKIEELCSSGDAGRDLAGLGCIAAAFNKTAEARRQPADPRFLYPTSRQFPFDETTYKIVKALEERDFNVPGIKVEFHSYGPSDSYRRVETIEGDDFRLWFCREQGRIGSDWNDTAAVSNLNIPFKELSVFSDNSGPTLRLYVGDNWEKDKEGFVNSVKVNSKLREEPRTYLRYSGSWQKSSKGGVYYPGKIAPFLTHTNDLDREYEPRGNEPKYFETKKIFHEFDEFLKGKLEEITSLKSVMN